MKKSGPDFEVVFQIRASAASEFHSLYKGLIFKKNDPVT
jgi:hypothetical protein